MKTLALFLSALLLGSGSVFAENNSNTTDVSIHNYRGYGNSFIFMENGIEFSVFADGQFDFYIPNYGPNVNVGFNTGNVAISFNAGYDYNPFLQYDNFGAIIQIENTPIFYDFYGRVSQIGNIFINYNNYGRVVRIGGLNIFYRNRIFTHHTGFINVYNRFYVYRPWHQFYMIPNINYCVVNTIPYRQYYTPVRHTFYRPYANNTRYFNVPGRRGSTNIARRDNTSRISDRYVQSPRNDRERQIQRQVENTRRQNTSSSTVRRERNEVTRGSETARIRATASDTRANDRTNNTKTRQRTTSENNTSNSVTRTNNSVSKNKDRRDNSAVRKPEAHNSRISSTSQTQTRQRSAVNSDRKATSVRQSSAKVKGSDKAMRSTNRRSQT